MSHILPMSTPRVSYNSLESDLVYPLCKGYKLICQVDPNWMKSAIRKNFGSKVTEINNKYAVLISGNLYYQHDSHTWLIEVEE